MFSSEWFSSVSEWELIFPLNKQGCDLKMNDDQQKSKSDGHMKHKRKWLENAKICSEVAER